MSEDYRVQFGVSARTILGLNGVSARKLSLSVPDPVFHFLFVVHSLQFVDRIPHCGKFCLVLGHDIALGKFTVM